MAKNNLKKITIDAVIPWVDGNDKNHQLKMIPYVDDKSIINSEDSSPIFLANNSGFLIK
mgnify:CR=1 FL=1